MQMTHLSLHDQPDGERDWRVVGKFHIVWLHVNLFSFFGRRVALFELFKTLI